MTDALQAAYERLTEHEAFDGAHVSLDREARGDEYVFVVPDWIDQSGLSFIVKLAAELELSLVLTKDGLRLEPHTSETLAGVNRVKDILREERDE
ncbi:MAG: hypothetical protein M3540_03930 [Actinomycetota bacterium]|nr:hypothetical protein [Actinomycetota bacterium]